MLSKAGVIDYRFHDNRHTAVTRLLRATGNLRLVQRLLGHSNIETTTKYAHVTDGDLAAGMLATAARNPRRGVEIPGKSPDEAESKAASD